nr:hypothetical protein [Tanacetum cinerariifolium]
FNTYESGDLRAQERQFYFSSYPRFKAPAGTVNFNAHALYKYFHLESALSTVTPDCDENWTLLRMPEAYPNGSGPGWLTEGIADYARYVYGVNNQAGNWKLPDYKAGQSYTNSYRIMARFLVWLDQHGYPKLVNQLDDAARTRTYTPEIWKQKTGKTLDELWAAYTAQPTVQLTYR